MSEPQVSPLRIHEIAPSDILTDALRFRRAMEIDTIGILLFRPGGEIVRANDAFLRMSGYSQEEVRLGQVRWTDMTPPEWKAASARALEQFLTVGTVSPYEKQYIRKDGSRFWVFIASKRLSPQEGIAFVLDVTERKDAEARLFQTQVQLERSDSQLQTITDAVPVLIAYVDPKLCYMRANRAYASFFGFQPEALLGKTMQSVLGENFAQISAALNRALHGEAQQLEVTLHTRNREERHMVSQYIPDISPEGYLLGIVIQSSDMTERRHTEHMLRTAEKLAAVGRLAASMAHEINNPLEAVMNLIFLARQSDSREATGLFLDQAEAELRRVSAITSQTLRFHKQATGPVAVQPEDLFAGVLTTTNAGRLLNGDVEVQQRIRLREAVVCLDSDVRQVLSHLVSNALDAMAGRPSILSLRACGATNYNTGAPGVRLTVADTGAGMSRTVLQRIWEPFFTTKEVGGTGLGLWISRDIAERHGGGLSVRTSPGVGTVFALWLPLEPSVR